MNKNKNKCPVRAQRFLKQAIEAYSKPIKRRTVLAIQSNKRRRAALARYKQMLTACESGKLKVNLDCYGVYAKYGKTLDIKKDDAITKAAWKAGRVSCDSSARLGKRFVREHQCDIPPIVDKKKANKIASAIRKVKGVSVRVLKQKPRFCLGI